MVTSMSTHASLSPHWMVCLCMWFCSCHAHLTCLCRLSLRRVLDDQNRPSVETLQLLDIIKRNCAAIARLAQLGLYPPLSLYHRVRMLHALTLCEAEHIA